MRRLQNTERVWWYIEREFAQVLGRKIDIDEIVPVTLVVSALTQMLADQEEPDDTPRPQPRSHAADARPRQATRRAPGGGRRAGDAP